MNKKTCEREGCPKEFIKNKRGKPRKFCGKVCGYDTYYRNRRIERGVVEQTKTCDLLECNNSFTTTNKIKKFCSFKCGRSSEVLRRKNVRALYKKCDRHGCNYKFYILNKLSKYCTSECQRLAARQRFIDKRRSMTKLVIRDKTAPIERKEATSISNMLREYGMKHGGVDRTHKVSAQLKSELLEARLAKMSVFTEDEYHEEIKHLSKTHKRSVQFLLNYADSLDIKEKKVFSYKSSYRNSEDFKEVFPFAETWYLLPQAINFH